MGAVIKDIKNVEKPEKRKGQPKKYVMFSSIALQMGVIIFIGTWLGQKTDGVFGSNQFFTISFSLISVFISLYYMYVKTKNES